MLDASFLLKEVVLVSEDASALGRAGLEAVDFLTQSQRPPQSWLDQQKQLLDRAKQHGAELLIAIVTPVSVAHLRRSEAVTDRIEINPSVLQGKPVIRGTRVPVELLLRKLAEGATTEDLLDAYPRLSADDFAVVRALRSEGHHVLAVSEFQ